MTGLQFVTAIKQHIEASGTVGPFDVIEQNYNPIDGASYSAIVRVWEGNVSDAVARKYYRFWIHTDGVALRKASIAKAEWKADF